MALNGAPQVVKDHLDMDDAQLKGLERICELMVDLTIEKIGFSGAMLLAEPVFYAGKGSAFAVVLETLIHIRNTDPETWHKTFGTRER